VASRSDCGERAWTSVGASMPWVALQHVSIDGGGPGDGPGDVRVKRQGNLGHDLACRGVSDFDQAVGAA